MNLTSKLFVFFLLVGGLFSCANQTGEQETAAGNMAGADTELKGQAFVEDDQSAKDILKIAIGSADHSTLVAGVQAAELENVLANSGPLTVFAPNNAAFDALPEGTLGNIVEAGKQGSTCQDYQVPRIPRKIYGRHVQRWNEPIPGDRPLY